MNNRSLGAVFLCPKGGDNLVCPYNIKSKSEIQSWNQENDEDQTPKDGKTIIHTVYKQMECSKGNCGAYYGGRCHYKD